VKIRRVSLFDWRNNFQNITALQRQQLVWQTNVGYADCQIEMIMFLS